MIEKSEIITREYPCPPEWLRFEAVNQKKCWGWTGYANNSTIQWVDDQGRYCVLSVYPAGTDKCRVLINLVPKDKAESIKGSFSDFETWLKTRIAETIKEA